MADMWEGQVYRTKRELITTLIHPTDSVLDVGFWGQAVKKNEDDWPHGILLTHAQEVYGVDRDFDESKLARLERYQKASAETFRFSQKFNVVFASELIEHLFNPGFFLDCARKHLKDGGRLILTTPNAFSLFPMLEKFFKDEPSVNPEHTMYFNKIVITKLLESCGFRVVYTGYLDSFHPSAGLRRLVRPVLAFFSLVTPKFLETIVVVAEPV